LLQIKNYRVIITVTKVRPHHTDLQTDYLNRLGRVEYSGVDVTYINLLKLLELPYAQKGFPPDPLSKKGKEFAAPYAYA
jgi:hypothetical protein